MKVSQLMSRHRADRDDRLGLYYNFIFYGVVLDKMQKQLIIRAPYVFYNKTLLTIEVVIKKSTEFKLTRSSGASLGGHVTGPASPGPVREEALAQRARFILKPEEKYPLDQNHYQNDSSIIIRVLD